MPYQPTGRPPGRPSYGARDKIIRAAGQLFAERGYTGTTAQAIWERAGVTKGSYFNYFASKGDAAQTAITVLRRREVTRIERDLANVHAIIKTARAAMIATTEPGGQSDELGAWTQEDALRGLLLTETRAALSAAFNRPGGRALVHLLADPQIGDSALMATLVRDWANDIRRATVSALTTCEVRLPWDAANQMATRIVATEIGSTVLNLQPPKGLELLFL